MSLNGFGEWGDTVIASVIPGWLQQQIQVLYIYGEGYRLRVEHREGLLRSHRLPTLSRWTTKPYRSELTVRSEAHFPDADLRISEASLPKCSLSYTV